MADNKETDYQNKYIDEFKEIFTQITKQQIRNIEKGNNDRTTTIYTSYSKDDILRYLRSPETSAKFLRLASRQLYQSSTHYRRLINYYANMPIWAYILSPIAYNGNKKAGYKKSYQNSCDYIEIANIKHESQKMLLITLIDGIFFGVRYQNNNSFFIQQLNPDYCNLCAIEDGKFVFTFDFSKIREEQLYQYPKEFRTLWNKYKETGIKEQEVPSNISFVIKADESTMYPSIPFASVMPSVYELENTKELLDTAAELDNYKLLQMVVETKDGKTSMPMSINKEFLQHIQNSLPEYVGVVMCPNKLNEINFEKSTTDNSKELTSAISNFWYNSGTMGALFGNPDITTSSAISIAIKVDEAYIYSLLNQFSRVWTAMLKRMNQVQKFKIDFIHVTVYSRDNMMNNYKTAATLGVAGSKIGYASLIGISQVDLKGLSFIENEVLEIQGNWLPLTSSYNSGETGRPSLSDEDVSESTSVWRDNV